MVVLSWQAGEGVVWGRAWQEQASNPLLWIIDTAPLFLGVFAYEVGRRQEAIEAINTSLQEQVNQQTHDLVQANTSLRLEVRAKREREEELVLATRQAEAGTRARDRFISSISHELRTPMNGVVGMAEELARSPLNEEQQRALETLQYSARHMIGLLDDVLELAKATAREVVLDNTEFTLAPILDLVEKSTQADCAAKGVKLVVQRPASAVPPLMGDPLRLGQILLNLVNWAVAFAEGPVVTLNVTAEPGKDDALDVRFEIENPQTQPLTRDRTWQDKDAREHEGTDSISLNVARMLLKLHGRTLEHERPGRGSGRLRFTLPFELGRPVVAAPPTPVEAPPQGRVLVVEDNLVNRKVAVAVLKRMGLEYDIAGDGEEALAKLAAGDFQLVLMDIQMPKMDGIEATRQIRASAEPRIRDISIVAVTASVLKSDVHICAQAGMDDFLAKPYKNADLIDKVRQWLAHPRSAAA